MKADQPHRLSLRCRAMVAVLLAAGAVICQAWPGRADQVFVGRDDNQDPVTATVDDGNFIQVVQKGDTCGRSYYVRGVMTRAEYSVAETGKFTGRLTVCTMERCTNPELLENCPNLEKNFVITCQGTYESLRHPPGAIKLTVEYNDENWSKRKCELRRSQKKARDVVIVTKPNTAPVDDPLNDKIKCVTGNLPYMIVPEHDMVRKCR